MCKKEAKKRASGAQCVLETIVSAKSEATGSADYGQTLRNIEVFTLGGFRRHESQKSRFGLLKSSFGPLFGNFVPTFGDF